MEIFSFSSISCCLRNFPLSTLHPGNNHHQFMKIHAVYFLACGIFVKSFVVVIFFFFFYFNPSCMQLHSSKPSAAGPLSIRTICITHTFTHTAHVTSSSCQLYAAFGFRSGLFRLVTHTWQLCNNLPVLQVSGETARSHQPSVAMSGVWPLGSAGVERVRVRPPARLTRHDVGQWDVSVKGGAGGPPLRLHGKRR